MGVDEKSAIIKIVDEANQINIHDASNMLLHYQAAKKNPLYEESVFGKRFIKRLGKLIKGEEYENTCVLCGHPVKGIVCDTCMAQLLPAVEESHEPDQSTEMHYTAGVGQPSAEWLMDELVRNMDSSMDGLANEKSVRRISYMLYAVIFMCIFNMAGVILILLFLKGVIS